MMQLQGFCPLNPTVLSLLNTIIPRTRNRILRSNVKGAQWTRLLSVAESVDREDEGAAEKGSLLGTLHRRRRLWIKRVWFFSLIALALGGTIHHLVEVYGRSQGPSADMAIVVDAVALVYLVYITWDEYTGKPLGLRSPNAKMRLIFLDIFFIVFDSANLSLAFASLSDVRGSCASPRFEDELDVKNDAICSRQAALASVLLIALVAWLLTFGISVFRLVERVVSK